MTCILLVQLFTLFCLTSGTYQCRAENSQDSADAAAILEVQVATTLVRKPSNARAAVKGDIELECEAYAVPRATVQWYKNGDLIIESDYFQVINVYKLTMKRCLFCAVFCCC